MTTKRYLRRVHSVADELIAKSREAALAAVQIFNNPLVTFRSEIFIVLINIAWTYMLHAYFRRKHIEYRYFDQKGRRRKFHTTTAGAVKHWELERCLNDVACPIDRDSKNNLRFLIGIRHEIEHRMTTRLDNALSAKFQACCLNFNEYIKKLFGNDYGIDKHLAFSLQFSSISHEQAEALPSVDKMPPHIRTYLEGFESKLSEDEFNSPRFAYRVLFVAKTANRKGQADQVIEFVKADSQLAGDVNRSYTIIKETERPKLLPSQIVAKMKQEGFPRFTMASHVEFWKSQDAKNPAKGFGTQIAKTWYWYENWLEIVRHHCKSSPDAYK